MKHYYESFCGYDQHRQPCGVHDDVENDGWHKHQCPCCNTVWKHHDQQMLNATQEQRARGHTCPNCGEQQYYKLLPPWQQKLLTYEDAVADFMERLFSLTVR